MKEKLIISLIVLASTIATLSWATPTLKNCGKSTQDSACSDAACRIDFDPATPITNCEMDFSSPQQNGWFTECRVSNANQVQFVVNEDGTHGNFYPMASLTSLSGKHIYTICTTYTQQDR